MSRGGFQLRMGLTPSDKRTMRMESASKVTAWSETTTPLTVKSSVESVVESPQAAAKRSSVKVKSVVYRMAGL